MIFDHYKIELLNTEFSDLLFKLINDNRARLEDFFAGTVSKTKTLVDTRAYCKIIEQKIIERSYFPFMITDVNTNNFIGLVDVKNIDWNVPKAELGSFIDTNYESKGIVTKSGELVVNHLIDTYKFKKLLCRASARNKGSIAVILKLGFEFEGTIKRDYRTTKGEIVDLNYYGRIFD